MIAHRPRRPLRDDRSGATLVEFALLLPVLMTLLCGVIEIGHMLFARVVLEGAVVDAGRIATASIASSQSQRDGVMKASIASAMKPFPLQPGGQISIQTRVFRNFSSAYPEPYQDTNKNGRYDLGETFTDRNVNGVWDAATPVAGSTMGGAGDVVSITATFPKQVLFGFLRTQKVLGPVLNLSATTVVRNEAVERRGA